MPRTYVAFLECFFVDGTPRNWETLSGYPLMNSTIREIKQARVDNSKIGLVDLKNNKRSFSFKQGAEVHIVNNVVIFDTNDAKEL